MAFKEIVFFYVDSDIQVASRPSHTTGFTFSGHPEARTIINTRRDIDIQFPFTVYLA